jgi:hypothetical protein
MKNAWLIKIFGSIPSAVGLPPENEQVFTLGGSSPESMS